MRTRLFLFPLFVLALGWSYQRSVDPLAPILTEEGQHVVFARSTWQRRELSKLLPLDQPWPASPADMQKAVERLGLGKSGPPNKMPMPARIADDVFLVGQDRQTNLTYLIDCGAGDVAIIDPTYESEVELTLANVEKCGYARQKIRWVINTHCHIDHAMADRKFRQLGAEIIVHEADADADAIEKGTRVTGLYNAAKAMGITEFPRSKEAAVRISINVSSTWMEGF